MVRYAAPDFRAEQPRETAKSPCDICDTIESYSVGSACFGAMALERIDERQSHKRRRARSKHNGERVQMKVFALAWLIIAVATQAIACPVCDTGTGVAVRTGIAENFSTHFLAMIAPFPVLFAAVALLHWGFPRRPYS